MSAQWESLMQQWGPPGSGGIRAMHMIHLFTGDILIIDRNNVIWLFDGTDWQSSEAWRQVAQPASGPPYNELSRLTCSGHCQLPDEKILFAGGNWTGNNPTDPASDHVYIFDPVAAKAGQNPWTFVEKMTHPRFYPTCTTLWDGRILISGGWRHQSTTNRAVQVMELYDPSTGLLTTLSPTQNQEFYPFMFLLPDETILWAGPGVVSTSAERMASRRFWWNANATPQPKWEWHSTDPAPVPQPIDELVGGTDSSAVIYDAVEGLVLKCGGHRGGPPTRKHTALFHPNHGANPWWESTSSMDMNHGRFYHDLVILPTQEIVVIGGVDGCGWREAHEEEVVWEAEVFNPSTKQWSLSGAGPMDNPRWYHSSAILLRDGSVLSAGGNLSATEHNGAQYIEHSAQILRPSYFDGDPDQPEFDATDPPPDEIDYEQTFQFKYTHERQGASIAKAALIRLAAVTHSLDMDQRYVPLDFTASNGTLSVTAPESGWIAPPGYYMLWIVDDAGVPCKLAHYIKVKPAP